MPEITIRTGKAHQARIQQPFAESWNELLEVVASTSAANAKSDQEDHKARGRNEFTGTTDFQSVAWCYSTDWKSVVQIADGKFYPAARLTSK